MPDQTPPAPPTDDPADAAIDETTADNTTDDDTTDAAVGADLDRVAADLDGVEAALARLDDGSYWTDEVTGEPIDEAVLQADPVARRNPAGA
jgi:RNA polymerase-binding transcription factor DksA